jgi:3-dehydroquinate synthase
MMIPIPFTAHPIYLGQNLIHSAQWRSLLTSMQHKRLALITDSHVADHYGQTLQKVLREQGFQIELFSFPAGEQAKTRETKADLEDMLFAKQYGRDTGILAVGGGLVTDLVGFLAATYCRGVPVIYFPTTLLAMVDASIGGKTGLNTPMGKNLIGTFTQPDAVYMDLSTLKTLPDCEWRNGIAEMVKHSLIANKTLFQTMQASPSLSSLQSRSDLVEVIQQNCAIKAAIVEQDVHEKNMRQLLNFGHTIGHAIETLEQYQIAHGEAVAIGLLVECHLAESLLATVYELLQGYGLPLQTTAFQNKDKLLQALILDKKSLRSIPRFVLLKDIGQPYVNSGQYTHPVDERHLEQAIDWGNRQFSGG